jgi:hypothetical protein
MECKTEHERMIKAIRLSNLTVIENLATKFKGLVADILKRRIMQLRQLFETECENLI